MRANEILFRWDTTVNYSSGLSRSDQAVVGVIDNTNLLLTNFRVAVVPPPMSSFSLAHSRAINHIGFLRHTCDELSPNRFFTVDESNKLAIFDCEFEVNEKQNVNLLTSAKLLKEFCLHLQSTVPLFYHHWLWLMDDRVVFCHNQDQSTAVLLGELAEDKVTILDETFIEGCLGSLTSGRPEEIICHLTNGAVQIVGIENGKFTSATTQFELNDFCDKFEAVRGAELKCVALKTQENLYVNDRKVATDVTSFFITEQFVLFTTLDQLKFIRLDTEQIINERRIERGGKLVVAVPRDSRTVLQMPRGNLEAIQPRVLSLCIIGDLLNSGEYRKAFDILRKQRINLNLMVDHDPVKFLEKIDHFVDDIQNIQWLNLFLSDLQDDDVTVTMYSSNYDRKNEAHVENFGGNKIEVICSRICEVFLAKGLSTFILPVITSHVKRKNLENALQIIWDVKQKETANPGGKTDGVESQEALKYLLYLVEVNDLYNVALGMYDFSLVLYVAQKSQKDPKEYIPFLNELKNFEENYRKYKVDEHLKRYERALEHIVKCGIEKLEECLELIDKRKLHAKALRLFKRGDECYNDVVLQFADHLRSEGKLSDACLMYERGGDYKQAILSAKHVLDWQKCIVLAKKCSHSEEELQQLCS